MLLFVVAIVTPCGCYGDLFLIGVLCRQTLDHQNKARRAIIKEMWGSMVREREVLKLWRRVVMLNTTQR